MPDDEYLQDQWITDIFITEPGLVQPTGQTSNVPNSAFLNIKRDQVTTHQSLPLYLLLPQQSFELAGKWGRFMPFKIDLINQSNILITDGSNLTPGEVIVVNLLYIPWMPGEGNRLTVELC